MSKFGEKELYQLYFEHYHRQREKQSVFVNPFYGKNENSLLRSFCSEHLRITSQNAGNVKVYWSSDIPKLLIPSNSENYNYTVQFGDVEESLEVFSFYVNLGARIAFRFLHNSSFPNVFYYFLIYGVEKIREFQDRFNELKKQGKISFDALKHGTLFSRNITSPQNAHDEWNNFQNAGYYYFVFVLKGTKPVMNGIFEFQSLLPYYSTLGKNSAILNQDSPIEFRIPVFGDMYHFINTKHYFIIENFVNQSHQTIPVDKTFTTVSFDFTAR